MSRAANGRWPCWPRVEELLREPVTAAREEALYHELWSWSQYVCRHYWQGPASGTTLAEVTHDFLTDLVLALRKYDSRRCPGQSYLWKLARWLWFARRSASTRQSFPRAGEGPEALPARGNFFVRVDDRDEVAALLCLCRPSEADLLRRLFGIDCEEQATRELAEAEGVTRQMISHRVNEALQRIRRSRC
jgi:DNA-directed RNA polymerase specialized sigma24 family protein